MKKIKLGQEARDKITGFTGILTGYCKYLTGCNQYHIQPKCETTSVYPDGRWIDEGKIEIITKSESFIPSDVQTDEPGCDCILPDM